MSFGYVRRRLPRALLTLSGRSGPVEIEFVIDTGFDGELALPSEMARQLDISAQGHKSLALADGSLIVSPFVTAASVWDEEPRATEVLVLDGNPLLGVVLLQEFLLQAEMQEGGEVLLEPL